MSTPTFNLALTKDELAILREALVVTSAIKTAQGLTEATDVLDSLRERADGLPPIRQTNADQADQHRSFPSSQGGVVNQSVTGEVSGNVFQTDTITGGIHI